MGSNIFHLAVVSKQSLLLVCLTRTQDRPLAFWLPTVNQKPTGQAILNQSLLIQMVLSCDVRLDV
jgi:hypothetical protein